MSGTFEHIAEMSHIKSFKKTTMESHHSLIQSVLRYHHIPDEINCIVKLLYSDFRLSIIRSDFCTKYIAVEKGVLQGDSISPLIFNFTINTFVQCFKEEKSTNFTYRTFTGFLPRNWSYAVAVTSLEGENQILFKSIQQMV